MKNTVQIRNKRYWSYLMIWLLICLVIKKLNPTVTELFIRGRKLNISLVLITQSSFVASNNISLNCTCFFIMKIPNKGELQQIAFNHSSDTGFEDFTNIYKKCTGKPYSFVVINPTFGSDHLHVLGRIF